MGQAQLLLIVLGVVLVGIAIIAGIQAYDQNNRKASLDALTHDAMRMASDLQIWAQKPVQFGGPHVYGAFATADDGEGGHEPVTLEDIGYDDPAVNTNGTCALSGVAGTTAATSAATITCTNEALGTQVVLSVEGVSDTDITVTDTSLKGATVATTG